MSDLVGNTEDRFGRGAAHQKKRLGAYLMITERNFLSHLHKNQCCGCSLESPHRGDSNEYPQHRVFFYEEISKIIS